MDSLEHIEEMIVTEFSGFFDQVVVEDLHVTIRIARDFRDFLDKYGDTPSLGEIAYVSDTIRSGMDQFFSLAQLCRHFEPKDNTWRFDPHLHSVFPELRRKFLSGFESLAESPDANAADSLASLLALTHLELVFLGQHFPLAIFLDPAPALSPLLLFFPICLNCMLGESVLMM